MKPGRRLLVIVSLSTVVLGSAVVLLYDNTPMNNNVTEPDRAIQQSAVRDHGEPMSADEVDTNTSIRDRSLFTEQKPQHSNQTTDNKFNVVYESPENIQIMTSTPEIVHEFAPSQETSYFVILPEHVEAEYVPESPSTETRKAAKLPIAISTLLLNRMIHGASIRTPARGTIQNVTTTPIQAVPVEEFNQGGVLAEQAQLILSDPAMQRRLMEITLQASEQVQALAASLSKSESELQLQLLQ